MFTGLPSWGRTYEKPRRTGAGVRRSGGSGGCHGKRTSLILSPCTGTPTGAQLSCDNEGLLSTWQNTSTSPTTTASYLYGGAGQRVQQDVIVNGSITSTTYIAGGLEEVVSNGAGTTLTKYFAAGGGVCRRWNDWGRVVP